ncbi:hypothetical protein GGR53DRAFT_501865 [Hypoxylon sp. FL1150]|nr:hypothetical protein GGR53DRAFT_501865 [Hypoxylon sp. FL1150]
MEKTFGSAPLSLEKGIKTKVNDDKSGCMNGESNPELNLGRVECYRYTIHAGDMHQPRIERGAHRWQRWILPLNH